MRFQGEKVSFPGHLRDQYEENLENWEMKIMIERTYVNR